MKSSSLCEELREKLRRNCRLLARNLSTTSHSFPMKLTPKTARWVVGLSLAVSLAIQIAVTVNVAITINEAAAAVLQLAAGAR